MEQVVGWQFVTLSYASVQIETKVWQTWLVF